MTATSSSTHDMASFGPLGAHFAINGITKVGDPTKYYEDLFHTDGDNYPWLAIDLVFYYKVSKSCQNFTLFDELGHRSVNGGES